MRLYRLRFPCHLNFYVVANGNSMPIEVFVHNVGINIRWRYGTECVYEFTDDGLADLLKLRPCKIIAVEGSRIRKEIPCNDFVDVLRILNE
jgi:hypothetical protein